MRSGVLRKLPSFIGHKFVMLAKSHSLNRTTSIRSEMIVNYTMPLRVTAARTHALEKRSVIWERNHDVQDTSLLLASLYFIHYQNRNNLDSVNAELNKMTQIIISEEYTRTTTRHTSRYQSSQMILI